MKKTEDFFDYDSQYGYCLCDYDFPICNHTKCVDDSNIGYTRGMTYDGIPFEAEVYETEDILGLVVIMPQIYERTYVKNSGIKTEKSKVTEICSSVETYDSSVLVIGMCDEGEEEDCSTILAYVEFLIKHGLVEFTGVMRNGAVMYVEDRAGNTFARVIITLKEGDEFYGCTDLDLKDFPKVRKRRKSTGFKVIKGGT